MRRVPNRDRHMNEILFLRTGSVKFSLSTDPLRPEQENKAHFVMAVRDVTIGWVLLSVGTAAGRYESSMEDLSPGNEE